MEIKTYVIFLQDNTLGKPPFSVEEYNDSHANLEGILKIDIASAKDEETGEVFVEGMVASDPMYGSFYIGRTHLQKVTGRTWKLKDGNHLGPGAIVKDNTTGEMLYASYISTYSGIVDINRFPDRYQIPLKTVEIKNITFLGRLPSLRAHNPYIPPLGPVGTYVTKITSASLLDYNNKRIPADALLFKITACDKTIVILTHDTHGESKFTTDGLASHFKKITEEEAEELRLREIQIQKELEERTAKIKEMVQGYVDNIKESALVVHSEEYIDVTHQIDDSNTSAKIQLIIHHPEVEITNSKGHKHTLKDLFVRFTFKYTGSKASPFLEGVEGYRTTLSNDEFNSNYSHSHLPRGAFNDFAHFCLGDTDTAQLVSQLSTRFDGMKLEALILIMNEYVKWESLEGGPYRHIQNIQKGQTNVINTLPMAYSGGIKDIVEHLLARLPTLPLDLETKEWGTTFIIQESESFEEQIVNFIQNLHSAHHSLLAYRLGSTDTYYSYDRNGNSSTIRREARQWAENGNFTFKGKTIQRKIESTENVENTENLVLCLNPMYKGHLFRVLESSINDFYLTEINDSN